MSTGRKNGAPAPSKDCPSPPPQETPIPTPSTEPVHTAVVVHLVQEYAPNGELFDYIVSKGRPTTEEAQRLFQQIVTAVEYCHFHNIVHR